VLVDNLNDDVENWTFNDGAMDYAEEVKKSFFDSLMDDIFKGAENGAIIGGCIIGIPGIIVGGLVGAIIGGLSSLVIKPFTKNKQVDVLTPLAKLINN
jgi:hypothetical protein